MKEVFRKRNVFILLLMTMCIYSLYTGAETLRNKNVARQGQYDNGKTVTLITTGTGVTKDVAILNALRLAIEKTFGAFVSANTSVVNDEQVKDEIVTVSSGNIESYKELNICQTGTNNEVLYEATVEAVVSIDNLIRFAQNHGMSAELAGQTFAMNIKLEALYAENEKEALRNLIIQLYDIANKGLYDFEIKLSEPEMKDGIAHVAAHVIPVPNVNYHAYVELANKTLNRISKGGKYICGWDDINDTFVRGKGNIVLRNDPNEFHEGVNEIFELQNGANFIFYFDRFMYLSKFAFGIKDNLGNQIEPITNLDYLDQVAPGEHIRRYCSLGYNRTYTDKDKIETKSNNKKFNYSKKYLLLKGWAGYKEVFKFDLGYSLSDISKINKIEVFPSKIKLLDNPILMDIIKGTTSPKDIYEEANVFYSAGVNARWNERTHYLTMAYDLFWILERIIPENIDKSEIKEKLSQIDMDLNKSY